MTTEEKFNAAVNVIRSLPKNGSYQPSIDMMLKFYAYFKQASSGPCTGNRPAFWDIKGRAKYDAWKNLGNMPKQDAMKKYVDELHQIVETMSYTDKVANFLEAPTEETHSLSMADLELVAGDVFERVRSQSNSPAESRDASPQRVHSLSNSSSSLTSTEDSDGSDEEYTDTVELPEPRRIVQNGTALTEPVTNGISHKDYKSRTKSKSTTVNSDISQEITRAIDSLRIDLERLSQTILVLETSKSSVTVKKRNPYFLGIQPQLFALIIIWPFVATFIMNRFLKRK